MATQAYAHRVYCTLSLCASGLRARSNIPVRALGRASDEISRTGTLFYIVRATGYNAAKVQEIALVPQPTGFGTGVNEHPGL